MLVLLEPRSVRTPRPFLARASGTAPARTRFCGGPAAANTSSSMPGAGAASTERLSSCRRIGALGRCRIITGRYQRHLTPRHPLRRDLPAGHHPERHRSRLNRQRCRLIGPIYHERWEQRASPTWHCASTLGPTRRDAALAPTQPGSNTWNWAATARPSTHGDPPGATVSAIEPRPGDRPGRAHASPHAAPRPPMDDPAGQRHRTSIERTTGAPSRASSPTRPSADRHMRPARPTIHRSSVAARSKSPLSALATNRERPLPLPEASTPITQHHRHQLADHAPRVTTPTTCNPKTLTLALGP